ncbi:MAG: phosphoglycolate phosphatase [Zetaproteobacteria bacterium CG12_big_fil_rev_8_21_14_0_65_54_13]|nr:MAG: phosphoglycolate phosphatase [Zetaproteobacteria bacterium CG23_combo_of_CG06-09_8_20_14_all_54_7]PIW47492.1 MAG: phosphoglycolate phosphatase [Zetaproteobacteria bacterium CG12_big_fil_rev_8_21_14_0_65_54_13]PIX53911.1 MAG: phosphoglycolate phosphatase [Zetaproteobacteria bacterium CG_4_10_14_3_um_filter_54_28]PJA30080.1 MAG: phosphoglycolate phosphatase [Zetaproteobacteria bacterium CG_4_9_14_3_um_filter_54_145]
MIKGVLLDMDGTLVDAFAPIIRALNQTFSEYGMPQMTAQEVKRHTGRGDCSMIALFGERREEAAIRFLEIHDEDYLQRIKPLDGAETLLRWLQSNAIPCAIVTSKSQSRAEAQLHVLGWTDLLQAVVGKIDGRAEKPDPAPLLLACEMLGIAAEHTVMVGDGIADMKAANRAGSRALGLCDGFTAAELTEAGADSCFESLTGVHAWLKNRL